ncbi:uncharacterized protein [Misgurnus anguillicaudatus]|uniref:uncharacterized protein isoform X2 n=1 Tax=Misgurnus anguillicaudatus TaxID=75329 RepID=UPI003CCFA4CC
MKNKNLPVQETVKPRASNQQVGGAQRKLSISPQAAGSGSTDPHEACPQTQHPVSSTVTSVFTDRQSKMSTTVDQVQETVEPSSSRQQVGGVQRRLYISPQAAGSGTTDPHEACPQINHPVSSTVTEVFTDRWFEMSTISTMFDLVQEAEEPMTSSQQVGGAQLRLSISPQAAGSGSPHEACPQTHAVSSTATKGFTGPQSKMSTIDSEIVKDVRVNEIVNEVEKSLTDKHTSKRKEEGCKAFFQRKLRAVKSAFKCCRGNKVEPLNVQLNASLDDKRADNVPGLDDTGLNDHQTDARDLAAHEPNAIRAQHFVKRGNKAEPLTPQLNAQLKKPKKRADAHPGPSGFGITDHKDPAAQTLSPSAFRAVPGPCDAAGLMLAKPESSDQKWAEFVSELRLAEALSTLEAVTKTSSVETDTVKSAIHEPSPLPGPSQLGQIPDTYLVDPNPAKDKYSSLYKLGKRLGEGYYGTVYKGTRKSDGQKVAIKFVKKLPSDEYIDIPGHPEPLETEVALNVLLSKTPRSPYVLPMYQWFDEPKRRILVLKYPNPCESVNNFISRHKGRVSEETARDIIIQAVYGAKHCLEWGVFHLDLTLDNMLINKKTLNLQLIDFGVGQYVGNDVDIDEKIEEHLPKEFYRRRRYLLENTTVFSIGAMMYEILHGHPPKRTRGNDLILKSSLSKECCDLLAQCLNCNTLSRPHIKQIIDHEWFRGTERQEELQEPEMTPMKKNIWKKLNKFFTQTKKATEKPLVPEPSPVPAPSQKDKTPDTYLCNPKPAKGKFTSQYKLGEKLGEGSFGTVFEGIRKSDGKKVAIKIVSKIPVNKMIEVPGYPEPLVTEIGLNVLLSKHPRCPYVLPMYQWYDEPKRRILVLEHPHPCETLSSFMTRNGGRLTEAVARDLIIQALLGAKHCLERGVFHQDINLNNLLINTETLRLKLIDFGAGQHFDTSVDINELLGKPSPFEFSKRCRYLAELTTVWDLGTVLYEMLHGYHPNEEGFKKKFHLSLSKECVDLLTQCLNRNRMLRPSVQQVIDHEWFRGIEQQEEPQESAAELSPVKKEKGRRSAFNNKLRKVFRKKERNYNLQ